MKCSAKFNLVYTDFCGPAAISRCNRESGVFPIEIVPAGAYFIYFLGVEKTRQTKHAKAAAKGISGIFPHFLKKILTAYPQAGLFNLYSYREVQIIDINTLTY